MKAYTQLIENKVMVSTLTKPEMKGGNARYWHRLLAEFESSILGEAENAHVSEHSIEGHNEITVMKPVFQMAEPNEPCEVEKSGDKYKIVKL